MLVDLLVGLGASLQGALWSSFAAQTGRSAGPADPDGLQAFRRFLEGELESFAFPEAAETLHVQFALSGKNVEESGPTSHVKPKQRCMTRQRQTGSKSLV